jgi:hypothetical protein
MSQVSPSEIDLLIIAKSLKALLRYEHVRLHVAAYRSWSRTL